MRGVFVLGIGLVAAFGAGYGIAWYQRSVAVPAAAVSQKPSRTEAVGMAQPVQKSGVAPTRQPEAASALLRERQAFYRGLLNLQVQEKKQIQEKIGEAANLAAYLRTATEDAQKAGSLEASLVHEARYRSSLEQLLQAELTLVALYERLLGAAQGYIEVLEGAALAVAEADKRR